MNTYCLIKEAYEGLLIQLLNEKGFDILQWERLYKHTGHTRLMINSTRYLLENSIQFHSISPL